MRAVVFRDVGRVEVSEVPEPHLSEPTDAIVRVTRTAICGSDLHLLHGKAPLEPGDTMGHEAVGLVEAVGSDVERFAVGDRVVAAFDIACGACWFCRKGQTQLCDTFEILGYGIFGGNLGGAQAELLRVPVADVNLLRVPAGMDDEHALFVGDALTTGVYAAGIARIGSGDTVAVVGAGPVGFFCVQAARAAGAAEVLALDLEPSRLALAERVGAVAIDVSARNARTAVYEHTDGRGADVVLEAVGSLSALDRSLDVVRRGGTVVVVGVYASEILQAQVGVWWARALDIRFTGTTPIHAWWERAMAEVESGRIDPIPLISHRLPLDEAARGYELFDTRQATKVLLEP
ncbi:MAG TPA: alcohol dehydrogenase catalytic domain-containing protein [Actinomycetes bacterium]|nr:alcohol dehydrogenase catalytic domain-containing protein [Actinomycetes bacterium]